MDGFTFEDVKDAWTEELRSKTTARNQSNADTRVLPSGCVLNAKFVTRFPQIRQFQVHPDDTWVLSFPKCGTTWTQEMVWLLKNKLDYTKAKELPIRERFPFLELEAIQNVIEDPVVYPRTIDLAAATPRPRCIKSHLPPDLLPKQIWTVKPKLVYVARNPKDAVISYFHHHRLWNGYTGSFEDFFQVFLADKVVFSPFWKHVMSYWKLRDRDHVLFNTFEEMKRDLPAVVRRTAAFLEVAVTDEEVATLCKHLSFASMKENKSVNYMDVGEQIKEQNQIADKGLNFIRTGESGGWKKVLTPQMIEQMDEWTKRELADTEFNDYPWA